MACLADHDKQKTNHTVAIISCRHKNAKLITNSGNNFRQQSPTLRVFIPSQTLGHTHIQTSHVCTDAWYGHANVEQIQSSQDWEQIQCSQNWEQIQCSQNWPGKKISVHRQI